MFVYLTSESTLHHPKEKEMLAVSKWGGESKMEPLRTMGLRKLSQLMELL